MSNSTTILRTMAATAIFAALSLSAAHANDDAHFRAGSGWQFTSAQHRPALRPVAVAQRRAPSQRGGRESWGSSSSQSASNLDDEVRHVDEMNQMFHDDAVNNAADETSAANAAAAQAQNDLINATAPVQPQ